MFHRAAATAVSHSKQPESNVAPFRFQQPVLVSKTLSPKSSSAINSRSTQSVPKDRSFMQHNKNHILLQSQAPKSNIPEDSSKQVKHEVYFNEDDFDDEVDFSFDIKDEIGCTELDSSQALSWPPSSYLNKTQDVTRHVAVPAPAALSADLTSRASMKSESLISSSPPSIVPKIPRRLPWSREAKESKLLGVKISQARAASTSSALREAEVEVEEDLQVVAPPRMNLLQMNERSLKVAIKEVKGKKRALEDSNPNKLRLATQTHAKSVAQVFLSKEQREVIELIKQGKSVFFTGSAGTGKSVLLREAIKELKQKYNNSEAVGITASTGLAACNIGGITLHSFAGVGLGKEGITDLVKKVKKAKKNMVRWTKTKVLIIDEISMVDAEFYDKLEAVARKIRANEKPWGGIQIVATGDFFQLPPVPDKGKVARFSFESDKWKALDHTIQLTTVFRQKDEGFVMMLNQMRTGQLSSRTINAFKTLSRAPNYEDGFEPTELFPTRSEVDKANGMRMQAIPGASQTFVAEDSGSFQGEYREKLLANCIASKQLILKRGAQVMLIKNRDESLVNGSLGVVVGFMSERLYTFALDEEDGTFDENMLRDSPWTDEELAACDRSPSGKRKMIKLMNMQQSSTSSKVWPVVRFKLPGGRTDIHQLMSPESWKFETPSGEIQACRRQVPLILAYAISIHKAQGQTIERVKVDLGKVFEKGQAYVALSRAVSQEGLQVLRFDAKKVMAHPKVAAFYRELSDVSQIGKEDADSKSRTKTITRVDSFDLTAPMTTQDVFDQIKREPTKAFPLYKTRG